MNLTDEPPLLSHHIQLPITKRKYHKFDACLLLSIKSTMLQIELFSWEWEQDSIKKTTFLEHCVRACMRVRGRKWKNILQTKRYEKWKWKLIHYIFKHNRLSIVLLLYCIKNIILNILSFNNNSNNKNKIIIFIISTI